MVRNVRTNQDNSFETVIRSLQPFMSSYDITSDKRVKLRINETADAGQLEKVLNNSQGKAERGAGNVVFVRFGELNNKDVRKIVSSAFGEPQDEDEDADNFDAASVEFVEDENTFNRSIGSMLDDFGKAPDNPGKDQG